MNKNHIRKINNVKYLAVDHVIRHISVSDFCLFVCHIWVSETLIYLQLLFFAMILIFPKFSF